MKKIRILLVEDNRLLSDGISSMVKKQPDMNVVASVANDENILPIMGKLRPDIVLLDLGIKSQNSLQVAKIIKKNFQETKIILMDLIPLRADVLEFVKTGVSGFILKDANVKEFLKTIRLVHQGSQVLPAHLTGLLFSQIVENAFSGSNDSAIAKSVRMTKRERQVIELIAEGFANKEIAQKLHLSTYTVKSHVHNVLKKLSLHTRIQIAKYAYISDSYKTAINKTPFIDE